MALEALPLSDRQRLKHLVRSTDQRTPLIKAAKEHGWVYGAEIGVLRGKTLFSMLEAIPHLRMYGVDQWLQLPLRPEENAETYHDFNMEQLAEDVISRAGREFPDRCKILRGESIRMAQKVRDHSLDFVFIDGDHTEPGVERDIKAWAPKVRAGGWVLGHDNDWNTVRRVINRLCPGWTNLGEAVWGIERAGVRV